MIFMNYLIQKVLYNDNNNNKINLLQVETKITF